MNSFTVTTYLLIPYSPRAGYGLLTNFLSALNTHLTGEATEIYKHSGCYFLCLLLCFYTTKTDVSHILVNQHLLRTMFHSQTQSPPGISLESVSPRQMVTVPLFSHVPHIQHISFPFSLMSFGPYYLLILYMLTCLCHCGHITHSCLLRSS